MRAGFFFFACVARACASVSVSVCVRCVRKAGAPVAVPDAREDADAEQEAVQPGDQR